MAGATLVIFGGSGDLTRRKLVPALYNLAVEDCLPRPLQVLGLGGREMSDEAYREILTEAAAEHVGGLDDAVWGPLVASIRYASADLRDADGYEALRQRLGEATDGGVLFYLATPPRLFGDIAEHLGAAGLTAEEGGRWRRLIVEKPFGRDLESARRLDARLRAVLEEHQIYRIDHYLGKETVQNIFALRFANSIFEPIWNRRYVDHVQITVAEELGVEERAGYYEGTGALRDMVPNHLLQLLSLIGMEPPGSFDPERVRDEKAKLLESIPAMRPEEVLVRAVRGQYGAGRLGDGASAPAYREEPGVAADSATETFVALELSIDNWRWDGVPFYLRTGKRLSRRRSEIAIAFKSVPHLMFRDTPIESIPRNNLVLHIQPTEGIALTFAAKVPGPSFRIGGVEMDFDNADYFHEAPTTGYETLLRDAIAGDATLFQRSDAVEAGWRIVAPILDVWSALPPRGFPDYPAGGEGPRPADELLARGGRRWRPLS